ncbi:endonuclease MutS2 [Brevibacillus sp. B_LB10_24]|uniref:endonuclease MutS2 n=1 Tax=Brevibacillus sp. B_LB10_24 TaxID=3380645 RepID=UPI0038B9AC8D
MNKTAMEMLEFHKIKEKVMALAKSEKGKDLAAKLQPSLDVTVIANWLKETTEARLIVDTGSSIPLHSLQGVEQTLSKLEKGMVLQPDQLTALCDFLENGAKLKKFMHTKESVAPQISSYAYSMYELEELSAEIIRCIHNGRVHDQASRELAKLRKKLTVLEERIKSKLESIVRSSTNILQDQIISMRDGRYVIPVKKEHRKHFDGQVLDSSSSGLTVFIEPAEVKHLQNEYHLVKAAEETEVQRILSVLTQMVESCRREIAVNIEVMANYDFIFAKAKYSKMIDGRTAGINTRNVIKIEEARHPMLGESCVPLSFHIGEGYRSLVITGPNTGGKTVAIKTVGLLTLMVQSGLHVPVAAGSEFAVFLDVLVDIGDGQSIEQSLSTFSSHIRNIISILACAKPQTLVILDELGSGTDPQEGMGLAISILEEIHRKGATLIATTHYSEIKEFANSHEGFENGSMAFDLDTLRPLYRLQIGQAGESQAFSIALRLGMNHELIERAHEITYKERKEYQPIQGPRGSLVQNEEVIQSHWKQVEEVTQLQAVKRRKEAWQKEESPFQLGDRVYVSSLQTSGIVCELENHKGELGVLVMNKKIKVNKTRLTLQIAGSELYPDNYDLSIVLETKENRKKEKQMKKRHVEGLKIDRSGEEDSSR